MPNHLKLVRHSCLSIQKHTKQLMKKSAALAASIKALERQGCRHGTIYRKDGRYAFFNCMEGGRRVREYLGTDAAAIKAAEGRIKRYAERERLRSGLGAVTRQLLEYSRSVSDLARGPRQW